MDKYKVLDLNVDNWTYESLIKNIVNNFEKQRVVFSVNPEITYSCQTNEYLKEIINSGDIKIADGIGIVKAVKFLYGKDIDRITGIDTINTIISSELANKKTFLYGAKQEVVELAAKNLQQDYKCNISGYHHGYEKDNDKVIDAINASEAEIVFVGLGFPKQEEWVYDNKKRLSSVKLFVVVGGSFDVFSKQVKRAPVAFQKLGLEWLYRLFKQPKRLFRQVKLIKYVFAVFRYKKTIGSK